MAEKKRLSELSVLNLLFCFMVLWSHCSGQPITVLEHSSWQYGLMICLQRLTFVSVSGFFFLSGLLCGLRGGVNLKALLLRLLPGAAALVKSYDHLASGLL